MDAAASVPFERAIANESQVLLPLGLMRLDCFHSFVFSTEAGLRTVSVTTDPFGWGWNLLGAGYALLDAGCLRVEPGHPGQRSAGWVILVS